MKKKVALGLSGGVDSAVSAWLLLQAGYEVTGVFMECYQADYCQSDQDKKDALQVALQLQIPFQALDFKMAYQKKVLQYFYQTYQQGKTPNPDMMCNREIKFGLFLKWALQQKFDYVATGHYARLKRFGRSKQFLLYTAVDKSKDQTYFLALVDQFKWERVLFPLGEWHKQQVRAQAQQLKLLVAEKKDSMGICFIGRKPLPFLLKEKIVTHQGKIAILAQGQEKIIGEHEGIEFYTIGQRHGLKIYPQTTMTPVYYVRAKDKKRNLLLVAEKKDLYQKKITLKMTTIYANFDLKQNSYYLRLRNQGEFLPIEAIQIKKELWQINLAQEVFAVSPGQFGVIYQLDYSTRQDYWIVASGEVILSK